MKNYLLGVIALSAAQLCFSAPQSKDEAKAKCLAMYPTDSSVLDNFKAKGEIPDESDRNAKCLFHCFPLQFGLTDEAGAIDEAKIKGMIKMKHPEISEDKVAPIVAKCTAERTETDVCDKWYNFTKCHMKAYLAHKMDS